MSFTVLAVAILGAAGALGATGTAAAAGALELEVTPSTDELRSGESVALIAEVRNPGGDTLTGVRVAGDTAPGDLTLLGARADRGVFDPASSTWFVGDLDPGASAVLELFARTGRPGSTEVVLLASADAPAQAVGAASANVVVTEAASEPVGGDLSLASGLLVTAGGALVVLAGLVHLRNRRAVAAG